MKNVKLDTLAWFQEGPGVRNTQYTKTGVKLINVTNLVDGVLDLSLTSRFISESEAYGRYNHFMCEEGDLVIASSGITYDSIPNKVSFVQKNDLPLCMNTSVIRFRSLDEKELNIKYLYYFFKSNCFRNQISKLMTGSAQLNFGPSHLHKIYIPICDLPEQKKIVSVLDELNNTLGITKKEQTLFDELIKVRFIEMFGDPLDNPNGYDIKPISELFDVGSSKRVFESEWTDSGVPFYRAREIIKLSNEGFVDNELFITDEMYETYKAKYGVPKKDDMMVTGVGTLGVCYIVKDTDKFYFKDGNILWFKNKKLCNVRFIKEQYEMDYVLDQIQGSANVSTVGTYTITNANETKVLVPPLPLQNDFVFFVESVDKAKEKNKNQAQQINLLIEKHLSEFYPVI